MNITIADVAKEAGVSKSTVSNYMNGKFEKMSYETRMQIEKTIQNMGYVPNLSARRLSNKRKSKTICLIIPGNITRVYDSMYYPTVLHAAEQISSEKGYKMLIYSRGTMVAADEVQFLKEMASSIVDGFMIFDLNEKDRFFLEFDRANIPYICAGAFETFKDYNFVASDHGKAMYDSIKYLSQIGHKRIGVLITADNNVVQDARLKSVQRFCEQENFDRNNIDIIHISNKDSELDILQKWRDIFTQDNRPSAYIISSSIRSAFILAAQDLNLKIPEDISYLNIEYYNKATMLNQEQTRVEMKAEKIVTTMFQELTKQINDPENYVKSNIIIALPLVLGETTAPPPLAE